MKALLAGAALGVSLAAPPGPVTAVMATAASRGRSREAILTALGAITGDAIWLGLATLVRVARFIPRLNEILAASYLCELAVE